jgi:DNA-binding response OmpR family regulator
MGVERHERKRSGTPAAPSQHLAQPRRGCGVLVIDDDPGIVDVLVMALHDDEGFAVCTAYSVTQALSTPSLDPPALILLDATLPGEEVHDAAARLRARAGWHCASIVLCSGRDDIATLACALGAAGYLRKPFDVDELVALAERYATRLSLA